MENKNPIIINHFKLKDDLGQISAIDLLKETNNMEDNDIDLLEENIENFAYVAKVIVNLLNVRNNPGFKNKIVSQLKKNSICTIVEEEGNWGKLSDDTGWVCLEYLEKIN